MHGAKTPRQAHLIFAVFALGAFALCPPMATAQNAPRSATRGTIDTNGDGMLDEQELRASREAAFATADAGGDGYLTVGELEAARMAGDVDRRTRGLGIALGPRGRAAETLAERLERLDTDGDGRVAKQEFLAAPHPLLRLDGDGDGRLTREELERGRERARKLAGRGVL
jgi:Ca2+-binding EF-hand superfamily protein